MSSKNVKSNKEKELIDNFVSVTGATREVGKMYIEASAGNINSAIEMFLEGQNASNSNSNHVNGQHAELSNDSSACSSNGAYDNDAVRAPIPQRMEKLVDRQPEFNFSRKRRQNFVFDAFRDFQSETESMSGSASSSNRTLQELFKPPLDLVFRGSFEAAKNEGQSKNKWLMVNVQNVQEFPCLALNRDVWRNTTVKDLVRKHFVLWQVYSDTYHGSKYMQFYKVIDWPYISFLDPRTGEKLRETNTLDAEEFCRQIREFIEEQGLPIQPDAPAAKKRRIQEEGGSILEASEEAQLKMAMLASMRDANKDSDDDDDDDGAMEGDDDDNEIVISDGDTVTISDMSDDDVIGSKNKSSKRSLKNNPSGKSKNKLSKNKSSNSKLKSSLAAINSPSETSSNGSENKITTKTYLGNSEEMSSLVLRLPDGTRHVYTVPSDSKVTILKAYVGELGFDVSQLEFLTCYPKRMIDVDGEDGGACSSRSGGEDSGVVSCGSSSSSRYNNVEKLKTLKDVGLFPKETIFVQMK